MRGIPFSLSHPHPDSSCGPRFLPGGPTPCANRVGHSGMSREPGEAGSAHRGWDGEEGVHADRSDKRDGTGLGGWGSAEVPGSWQGRESGRARTDRRNCTSRSGEKRERAMLGPQQRGAVSILEWPLVPRVISLLSEFPDPHTSPSFQFTLQKLHPWVPCPLPAPRVGVRSNGLLHSLPPSSGGDSPSTGC